MVRAPGIRQVLDFHVFSRKKPNVNDQLMMSTQLPLEFSKHINSQESSNQEEFASRIWSIHL